MRDAILQENMPIKRNVRLNLLWLKAFCLFQSHMDCMQGEYLSPRVVNLTLQYLTHAVTLSHTWKAVKPQACHLRYAVS